MFECFNIYSSTVDTFDTNKGLNNFAEGALSICSIYRNESQQWTSTLTPELIAEMPEVKAFLSESKDAAKRLTAADSDLILPSAAHIKEHLQFPYNTNTDPATGPLTDQSKASCNHYGEDTRSNPHPELCGGESVNHSLHNTIFTLPTHSQTHGVKRKSINQESQKHTASVSETSSLSKRNRSEGLIQQSRGPNASSCGQSDPILNLPFKTAKDQLLINQQLRGGRASVNSREPISETVERRQPVSQMADSRQQNTKRSLGTRRAVTSRFISPVPSNANQTNDCNPDSNSVPQIADGNKNLESMCADSRLKSIDPKMIELIMNEVMDHGPQIAWDDIAGLKFAKKSIKEIIVWPMLRPDIFTGLRGPPKGLLLFGPPGTGKTLIGKCVASQSKSTFFSISASSLTSKWVGEGEKMVRALFAVSRCKQPAVIFIDEIDSLLTQRGEGEHESTRRLKTEFLVQLDGATTVCDERLLVIGATNRPAEIDDAARRRFVKRLYIPLPDLDARRQLVANLLARQKYVMSEGEMDELSHLTDGYSGSDIANLCREAALGPIRCIEDIENILPEEVRPINYSDFRDALQQVRASVSSHELGTYEAWNNQYGSGFK